jgi:hypothetical protein
MQKHVIMGDNYPTPTTLETVPVATPDTAPAKALTSSDGVGDENAPCPWCGGKGKLHRGTAVRTKSPRCLNWVVCGNSDCRASLGLGEWTEAEAFAKWNRRAKGASSPTEKAEPQAGLGGPP